MYVVFDINTKTSLTSSGSVEDFNQRWPSFRNLLLQIYHWTALPINIAQDEGKISVHHYDPDDELICPSANVDSRNQDLAFQKDGKTLKVSIEQSTFSEYYSIELKSADPRENFKFLASRYRTDYCVELNNPDYQLWVDLLNQNYGSENVVMGPVIMKNKIGCSDENIVWKWFSTQLNRIYKIDGLSSEFPKQMLQLNGHSIKTSLNFDFQKKKDINIYYIAATDNEKVSTLAWPDYIILRVYVENPYRDIWTEALVNFNPEDWQ